MAMKDRSGSTGSRFSQISLNWCSAIEPETYGLAHLVDGDRIGSLEAGELNVGSRKVMNALPRNQIALGANVFDEVLGYETPRVAVKYFGDLLVGRPIAHRQAHDYGSDRAGEIGQHAARIGSQRPNVPEALTSSSSSADSEGNASIH
jgi:hypothetical protein